MGKGTKIYLIVLAVLSLGCVIGVVSLLNDASSAIEKTKQEAVTEGNEILALFASDWDTSAIALRTAEGYLPPTAKIELWKQQFGGLVGGSAKLADFEVTKELLTARLTCRAEFDKGQGDVSMTLTREPRNSWMLADFDVKPVE